MKDYAVIGLPTAEFGRFIRLPDSEGKTYLMFLDDVIQLLLADDLHRHELYGL